MPIHPTKDRKGRARLEFEFDRVIKGERVRVRKRLPLGWSRAQADAFDRTESARLYAVATGVEKPRFLIEAAVARYIRERVPELKHGASQVREMDHLEPYWQGKHIDQLHEVCAAYLADHRAKLAPATIKNRLRYLVSACRWGWKRHRMCEHDPGAGVVYPAVSNARQVYITREQMLRLARACEHRAVRAMIRIAFYSGMRMGEIRAAAVDGDFFVLPDSKNGDPVRMPIHPRLRCLLRYEWPTRFIVGYWFRKARAAVGLEHVRFHDERHSTASELISAGRSLAVVGKVLRHKTPASTQRYAHLYDEVLLDAINGIGRKKA